MKIVVDARLLCGGGIGRYIQEVGRRWLADPRVTGLRFLGRPRELEPWLDDADPRGVAEVVPFELGSYAAAAQAAWLLRGGSLRGDADVAFFPHYDVPLVRHPHPSLVVIHDLTHYLLPEHFPARKRIPGRFLVRGAVRRADRLVTVSERSRADLLERHPEAEGKLSVAPSAVSDRFRPLDPSERAAAEERWGRYRPYLLLVGSERPHKNTALGAEVLAGLADRRPDLRLLVVGGGGAATPSLRDRIVELDPVSDDELRELYALCSAFLFPSYYEGFGMPPLEAMACGAPVVASDRGALPEVLGGRAPLADPDRPAEWIERVEEILEKRSPERSGGEGESTDARSVLREREPGDERIAYARSFTWDRTAARLLDLLAELAEGARGGRSGEAPGA